MKKPNYHWHPALHRARQGEHDHRIQEEASLAAALLSEFPDQTRSCALKEAAHILDRACGDFGVREEHMEKTHNITDEQIEILRDEAGAAGDLAMVDLCTVALRGCGMDVGPGCISDARARCAKAISDALVMDDQTSAADERMLRQAVREVPFNARKR